MCADRTHRTERTEFLNIICAQFDSQSHLQATCAPKTARHSSRNLAFQESDSNRTKKEKKEPASRNINTSSVPTKHFSFPRYFLRVPLIFARTLRVDPNTRCTLNIPTTTLSRRRCSSRDEPVSRLNDERATTTLIYDVSHKVGQVGSSLLLLRRRHVNSRY